MLVGAVSGSLPACERVRPHAACSCWEDGPLSFLVLSPRSFSSDARPAFGFGFFVTLGASGRPPVFRIFFC